ncbi:menaquinone biosynthesis protein [bacterium]|nr:menaquinone biosynthesis protein [bacterium]
MQKNLGVVGYVNSLPLVFGLLQQKPKNNFNLIFDTPRLCSQKLSENKISLGLIPSIEFARIEESLAIVPNLCIASQEYVKSVELFFRKDLRQIKKIAVDYSSKTSVALLKILCLELYKINPEFVECRPNVEEMLKIADAALVIGDSALYSHDSYDLKFDLAEDWVAMTGLPFVFALWVGKKDSLTKEEVKLLQKSKDFGMKNIDLISQVCNKQNPNFAPEFYEKYFTENISYELGKREKKGLTTFYELAFAHGLTEQIPDLKFFE